MSRLLSADVPGKGRSWGLLLLRLVMGAAFIFHGWGKIQAGATHWMPAGSPVPGALQAAAAFSEFCGGIALMTGFLTPLAATFLAIVMAVAVKFHLSMGHPFVSATGGPSFELAAAYLAAALMFVMVGPGRFSLDALLFGPKRAVATSHSQTEVIHEAR